MVAIDIRDSFLHQTVETWLSGREIIRTVAEIETAERNFISLLERHAVTPTQRRFALRVFARYCYCAFLETKRGACAPPERRIVATAWSVLTGLTVSKTDVYGSYDGADVRLVLHKDFERKDYREVLDVLHPLCRIESRSKSLENMVQTCRNGTDSYALDFLWGILIEAICAALSGNDVRLMACGAVFDGVEHGVWVVGYDAERQCLSFACV